MADPKTARISALLRLLPSTDELIRHPRAAALQTETGPTRLIGIARRALDEMRRKLPESASEGTLTPSDYSRETLIEMAVDHMSRIWNDERGAGLRRVINATGVVIHTNLGRAPLSEAARAAVADAAGYTTLEYDIREGKRGKRGVTAENMLCELTGAEAALVVNNCAAAAFLVLSVIGKGGEAIISRGELVEIGGDFRVPDVLSASGTILREIGTTNRTKLADYERAISDATRLLMRVHPSNYRIVGFTGRPSTAELAKLAHRFKIPLYEDAGSGALADLSHLGLSDEPVTARSITDGADVVTFSGDKLLGGPQAGLIVGTTSIIERLRKSPLYRALRVDKMVYAALEATLDGHLRGSAGVEVPVMRMLSMTKASLSDRARRVASAIEGLGIDGLIVELREMSSVVGGGAAPGTGLPTVAISASHRTRSASQIEAALRQLAVPVITRIENDRVIIDLRTVDQNEEEQLVAAFKAAI